MKNITEIFCVDTTNSVRHLAMENGLSGSLQIILHTTYALCKALSGLHFLILYTLGGGGGEKHMIHWDNVRCWTTALGCLVSSLRQDCLFGLSACACWIETFHEQLLMSLNNLVGKKLKVARFVFVNKAHSIDSIKASFFFSAVWLWQCERSSNCSSTQSFV